MAHFMSLGVSDFKKIREDHYNYIDKSHLISEILEDRSEVIVLPRPRRFGKTLNLTMLREFFDDRAESRALFEGLAICQDPDAMAHLGTYPTIYVSFKDLKPDSWESCQERLIMMVSAMFDAHWTRIEASDLPSHQKELAFRIVSGKASLAACQDGLRLLTHLLQNITGKRVVLLIDEYDSPIHAGYQKGYRDEIIGFMRDFLSGGFKDNSALRKGVLTGILRVVKDSIFSGLNNLSVYTILDNPFSTRFGFTGDEVQRILFDAGLMGREQEVQRWYNGYRFGATTLYNPWSILSIFRDPDAPFTAHWIHTADNALIRDLVVAERAISLSELTVLLSGEAVERVIDPFVVLNDLKPESIWGLMLLSGYLTLAEEQSSQPMRYALRIPNLEVRTFFESTVSHWMGQQTHTDALMQSLLQEDMPRFAELLAETVIQVLSYHDMGGSESERVYHAFLAGLMVHLNQTHQVHSNREAGFGRYDLALTPKQQHLQGFVFELKRGEPQRLADQAQAALSQIAAQDYSAVLRQQGIKRIRHIGLAFDGKRIALASAVWEQATGIQTTEAMITSNNQATQARDSKEIERERGIIMGALENLASLKDSGIINESVYRDQANAWLQRLEALPK